MDAKELRALQTPLKERYRKDPGEAMSTLSASGTVGEEISFEVPTWNGVARAGLHPLTGGDGTLACSGDMLLQALVACAGVTLRAVATAMEIPLRGARISVEGDLDFRGTLGVSKEVPVGFGSIRVQFELDSDATREQLEKLIQITERYCVVMQTLRAPPAIAVKILSSGS